MELRTKILIGALILVITGSAYYSLYAYKRTIKNIRAESVTQKTEIEELKASLAGAAAKVEDEIFELEKRQDALTDAIVALESNNSNVLASVSKVTSTVNTLEKLSKTDSELLKQYSKVYFLNEHYVPISLSEINTHFTFAGKKLQIHSDVAPSLGRLLLDAEASGMNLRVDSAYRSFSTQATLKSTYKVTYGAGTANAFSAEQGYSEHQLGTTVDFTTPALNGGFAGFDKTIEYQWLQNNAYRYGFVISYPRGNGSYVYEPWHWRFVGKKLAQVLHDGNMYFYNMDQREIDTYLATIFD
ncbi:MAG: M15 family metallopeptidase [Candidatus Pacebacteria bacterium]|nr:M15 family metallopeptidase [Candidatus Paceibacterota bacterium]